jgi:hypothetical protein
MSDAPDETYGVELSMADVAELTSTGELRYSYVMADGERVEVRLFYDGDDDDDRDGGGHKVTTTLR